MDPNSGYSGGDRTVGGGAFAPPRGYALSGKIMLSAIVVLFTVVLLVLFLHLYVRWHLLRLANRRRRRRRARLVFADEAQRAAASAGLDPEAIKSLPVVVCSADACSVEGDVVAECAVCLNEFDEGEKVRKLPRCGHRFHIECIDMWFYSHATCPLCRSPVEPAKIPPAAAVEILVAEPPSPAMPADLCSSCVTVDLVGSSSSSASGAAELRIGVPARRTFDDEMVLATLSPGGFKSPGGRIRAIRRLLSRDRMLCRGGDQTEEQDLERGEAAERAHPPPHAPPTPPPPPPPPHGVER